MSEPAKLQVAETRLTSIGRVVNLNGLKCRFRLGDWVACIRRCSDDDIGPFLEVVGMRAVLWLPKELRHATDVEILAAKLEGRLNDT